MSLSSEPSDGPVDAVKLFASYPFSSDPEYQQGEASIMTMYSQMRQTDDLRAEVILQAKLFFFNRKTGSSLKAADVAHLETAPPNQQPLETRPNPTSVDAEEAPAPESHTLSFAELKALIEEGKTDGIPNNRVIPSNLNDEAPSESTAPVRRKPWEITQT